MSKSAKSLALFGGGGFIGSNLAHHLESTGTYMPVVLDKVDRKLRLRYGDRAYRFMRCDVAQDLDMIDRAVRESDIVVNLAAHVRPSTFIRSPLEVIKLNLFDSLHVVEACVRHRRRLIHFSTCEVYGKTGGRDEPFREDDTDCVLGPIVNHRWIYSSAKLLDRIIHAHGLNGEFEYTILRPFNFVGPLMDWLGPSPEADHPRVFAHFMSALMFGRPMRLVDGGQSRRCFTYIEDATRDSDGPRSSRGHPQPDHQHRRPRQRNDDPGSGVPDERDLPARV